jgi:hypothetical protein
LAWAESLTSVLPTDIDRAVAYYGTYIEHRIREARSASAFPTHGDEGPLGQPR